MLLSRGVHPKFVQELLGHATIAITLDTYSHVLPGLGDAAAERWMKHSVKSLVAVRLQYAFGRVDSSDPRLLLF